MDGDVSKSDVVEVDSIFGSDDEGYVIGRKVPRPQSERDRPLMTKEEYAQRLEDSRGPSALVQHKPVRVAQPDRIGPRQLVKTEEESEEETLQKARDILKGQLERTHGKVDAWDIKKHVDQPSKLKVGHKDTNPKDAVGTKKWRQYCTVPITVIWEIGVAMLEGARKYGRHNYRIAGVRASVYLDAAKGHMDCYWEGEDIDDDSGLSHITKAIASLTVLRDAQIQGKCLDDRPPKTKNLAAVKARLQEVVEKMFERHPDAADAYLEGDQYE